MKSINIALLSAMPEEVWNTIENLENITPKVYGDLKVYFGRLKNKVSNYESVYRSCINFLKGRSMPMDKLKGTKKKEELSNQNLTPWRLFRWKL